MRAVNTGQPAPIGVNSATIRACRLAGWVNEGTLTALGREALSQWQAAQPRNVGE
jgi:hypothetical protein